MSNKHHENIEKLNLSNNKADIDKQLYSQEKAIKEFEELKNIALNCLDKNGNPNIQAAIKALENKAKIAGLYKMSNVQVSNLVKMTEIKVDGEQLKLDIGEDLLK